MSVIEIVRASVPVTGQLNADSIDQQEPAVVIGVSVTLLEQRNVDLAGQGWSEGTGERGQDGRAIGPHGVAVILSRSPRQIPPC